MMTLTRIGRIICAVAFFLALGHPTFAEKKETETIKLHGNEVHFQELIQQIAKEAGLEAAIATDLGGTCSVNLYDVTPQQALDILCTPFRARWLIKDSKVHVMSEAQFAKQYPVEHQKNKEVDQASETDKQKEQQEETRKGEPSKIEVNVTDLEISKVLQLLCIGNRFNSIHTDQVSGKVSLSMKDVTVDEVIDHILESEGLRRIELENCLWIVTESEWEDWQDQQKKDER
ncbi:MAG: hypothetical protein AAGB26_03965 [Planctomycetota bacterium]